MCIRDRPHTPEVAASHAEHVAPVKWVVSEGGTPSERLDVIEKPWRWQVEADAARSLEDAMNGWHD